MASASVTNSASIEADIISDLLKKSFSARPTAEQDLERPGKRMDPECESIVFFRKQEGTKSSATTKR